MQGAGDQPRLPESPSPTDEEMDPTRFVHLSDLRSWSSTQKLLVRGWDSHGIVWFTCSWGVPLQLTGQIPVCSWQKEGFPVSAWLVGEAGLIPWTWGNKVILAHCLETRERQGVQMESKCPHLAWRPRVSVYFTTIGEDWMETSEPSRYWTVTSPLDICKRNNITMASNAIHMKMHTKELRELTWLPHPIPGTKVLQRTVGMSIGLCCGTAAVAGLGGGAALTACPREALALVGLASLTVKGCRSDLAEVGRDLEVCKSIATTGGGASLIGREVGAELAKVRLLNMVPSKERIWNKGNTWGFSFVMKIWPSNTNCARWWSSTGRGGMIDSRWPRMTTRS